MTPRRIFSIEFKREALHLTQRPDVTVTQAARDLGIGLSTLQRWLREAGQQGDAAFPGHGCQNLTPKQEEIRRLRKEVEILRDEREILKKATAFFAKQSRSDSCSSTDISMNFVWRPCVECSKSPPVVSTPGEEGHPQRVASWMLR